MIGHAARPVEDGVDPRHQNVKVAGQYLYSSMKYIAIEKSTALRWEACNAPLIEIIDFEVDQTISHRR